MKRQKEKTKEEFGNTIRGSMEKFASSIHNKDDDSRCTKNCSDVTGETALGLRDSQGHEIPLSKLSDQSNSKVTEGPPSCTDENENIDNSFLVNSNIKSLQAVADRAETPIPEANNIGLSLPSSFTAENESSKTVTDSEINKTGYDPGEWSLPIHEKDRVALVRKGPIRQDVAKYPVDSNNRHFSSFQGFE